MHVLYECGICGSLHPWNWSGDCRDDDNRFPDEWDYAERKGVHVFQIEIKEMEERVAADLNGEP